MSDRGRKVEKRGKGSIPSSAHVTQMGMAIRGQAKGLREERSWGVASGIFGKTTPLKDEKKIWALLL